MHCPACGKEAAGTPKFCRSCGMDLLAVSGLVAQHLPSTASVRPPAEGDAEALHRLYSMLLWGIGVLLVGLALLAFGKKIEYVSQVGILMMLAGTFISFYGVISPLRPKKRGAPGVPEPAALPQAESTAKLPPASPPDLIPSVTEQTTRNLEPALRDKPVVIEDQS